MATTPSFVIVSFKNRNGSASWRLSGWLSGVRIRRNFKTREEAAAEKSVLEIQHAQAAAGCRAATTFLDDKKLREAEDALRRVVRFFGAEHCALLGRFRRHPQEEGNVSS